MVKMNLRKLLVLLVVGVLAITVISGCTGGPPTATAPSGEPEPSAEGTYLEATSQELKEIIFDERLIQEQRQEIWHNQYQGKRVRWLGVLDDAPSPSEVEFESGEDVRVKLLGSGVQDLAYEHEWWGDVLWFTGTLSDYAYFDNDFLLTQGTMGPLVLERIWTREVGLDLPWGPVEPPHLLNAAGVNSRYFYYYVPRIDIWDYFAEIVICVVDKANGYFVSDRSIEWGEFRHNSSSFPSVLQEIRERAKQEILSMADDDLVFLTERLPVEATLDGLILRITDEGFSFYDAESERLLCTKHADIATALVQDDIVYVSGVPKVKQFASLSYSLGFTAYHLCNP